MKRALVKMVAVFWLVLIPITGKGWGRVWFAPGDDCAQAIMTEIRGSSGPILIEAYNLTDQAILEELKAALARGVKIYAIMDWRANFDNKYSISRPLAAAGATVVYDKKHPISHSKVFIFLDQKMVLTGSYNPSANARKNHENLTDKTGPDVDAYISDFWQHWPHCLDGDSRPVGEKP